MGEVLNIVRFIEVVVIDDIIINLILEEFNIIEECLKKYLCEGEYFR